MLDPLSILCIAEVGILIPSLLELDFRILSLLGIPLQIPILMLFVYPKALATILKLYLRLMINSYFNHLSELLTCYLDLLTH